MAETTVFKHPNHVVLRTIMSEPYFCWPKGRLDTNTGLPDQNPKKRCSFHNELGQYTTTCGPFKAYLEQLVTQGHMDQYIDPARQPVAATGPNLTSNGFRSFT